VTDFQQCAWRSPEGHCCLLAAGHDDEHQTFFEVPLRGAPATRPQDVPSPAVTDAVKPLTREELMALRERIDGWKRMYWGPYNVALVLEACDRLLATARAFMEDAEEFGTRAAMAEKDTRRLDKLFDLLPFEVRHRFGGDVREFREGIDAARRNTGEGR
jgi:hypothetical protein